MQTSHIFSQVHTGDTQIDTLMQVPTGMYTLPGYTPNIGNALLAVPYQIDYLFFKSD